MKVLGISAWFHDAAAALVVDGKVTAAAQEERFSRVKHDAAFPAQAISFVLQHGGLCIEDLDAVVFYEKPLRKFERLMTTHLRAAPRSWRQFISAMSTWLSSRLWLKADIVERLGCKPEQIVFSEHHLSHAASIFFTAQRKEAAVVCADGVGEWACTTIFDGVDDDDNVDLVPVAEQHFPHSIGLVYSALTAYLGFRVNNGEYKVMGLAAYGEPRFVDELHRIARVDDDGVVDVDLRFFSFHTHDSQSFTPALEALLGPARAPDADLDLSRDDDDTRRWCDVAASIQLWAEEAMLAVCREAKRLTGRRHLCLAGGVALNSVANRRIAEEAGFDTVDVHPAAGDAGGALGAALYVSRVVGGDPRVAMSRNRLGPSSTTEAVAERLQALGLTFEQHEDEDDLAAAIADALVDGQVCALVSGAAEWGPRALGHRSILADPRRHDVRDHVNVRIKRRERFRPFAPAVLVEDVDEWFDTGAGADRTLWSSMQSVLPAKQAAREQMPGVVHVDGTARVQSVDDAEHPRLAHALRAFKARTGVGVLLNTSMNLRGDPPVCSVLDAVAFFAQSSIDVLVVENCIVRTRLAWMTSSARAHLEAA